MAKMRIYGGWILLEQLCHLHDCYCLIDPAGRHIRIADKPSCKKHSWELTCPLCSIERIGK